MILDLIGFGIWIILEELVDLLPVKVRRIIGTILLFIGILGLSIAWYGLNQEFGVWDMSWIIYIFLGAIKFIHMSYFNGVYTDFRDNISEWNISEWNNGFRNNFC